ncbi:IS110 family transposase [Micromonospora globbae]|nr:IS110 family transposase [Micromonospora globbae]
MTRFPNRAHFASWNGTAPIDAFSGEQVRHRLPAPETGKSTGCCTSWPLFNCATAPRATPTSTARRPPARHRWKRCAR